jgi:transketolase
LVVGDLGFGVVEKFADDFPDNFVNCGVAEQLMIGVASGLTRTMSRVFVYSIANFPTIRCLEQIRNDVCYHNLNVTIVAIGAGLAYGSLGYTHHAVEDLAVMRAMPNMAIFSPSDSSDVRSAMTEILNSSGPSYLRLSKTGEPDIERLKSHDGSTSPEWIRHGHGPVVVTTGLIAGNVVDAANLLSREGIQVGIIKVNRLQPLASELFDEISQASQVFVVEEHITSGGFGSLVLEEFSRNLIRIPTTLIGITSPSTTPVGTDVYLREHFGLNPEGLARQISERLLRVS